MEILLVVAIVGVSLAVAVPNLAKSYRGARLRQSGRTVQMMHRQAKAKAVLGQCHAALFFDDVKRTVELVVVDGGGESGVEKDAFFGEGSGGDGGGGGEEAVATHSELTKAFEEGVELADFRGGGDVDGVHWVQYYPNGMCQEWKAVLRDDEGRELRIEADPVTGKLTVEQRG